MPADCLEFAKQSRSKIDLTLRLSYGYCDKYIISMFVIHSMKYILLFVCYERKITVKPCKTIVDIIKECNDENVHKELSALLNDIDVLEQQYKKDCCSETSAVCLMKLINALDNLIKYAENSPELAASRELHTDKYR